jgi:hypothetical protein
MEPPSSPLSDYPSDLFSDLPLNIRTSKDEERRLYQGNNDDQEDQEDQEEEEVVEDTMQSTSGKAGNIRGPYTSYRPSDKKIETVLKCLKDNGLSLAGFLRLWIKDGVVIESNRAYKTGILRRKELGRVVTEFLDNDDIQYNNTPKPLVHALQEELDAIIASGNLFRKFSAETDGTTDAASASDFVEAHETIVKLAPKWYALLQQILGNQRAERASYQPSKTDLSKGIIAGRIFTITFIACYSRSRKNSNFLPTILGMNMLKIGTKRRILDITQSMGVIPAYETLNSIIQNIAEQCKVCAFTISICPAFDSIYECYLGAEIVID